MSRAHDSPLVTKHRDDLPHVRIYGLKQEGGELFIKDFRKL